MKKVIKVILWIVGGLLSLLLVAVLLMVLFFGYQYFQTAGKIQAHIDQRMIQDEARSTLSLMQSHLQAHKEKKGSYKGIQFGKVVLSNPRYGAGFPAQAKTDPNLWIGYTTPEYIQYASQLCPDCLLNDLKYKIVAMTVFEGGVVDAWVLDSVTKKPVPLKFEGAGSTNSEKHAKSYVEVSYPTGQAKGNYHAIEAIGVNRVLVAEKVRNWIGDSSYFVKFESFGVLDLANGEMAAIPEPSMLKEHDATGNLIKEHDWKSFKLLFSDRLCVYKSGNGFLLEANIIDESKYDRRGKEVYLGWMIGGEVSLYPSKTLTKQSDCSLLVDSRHVGYNETLCKNLNLPLTCKRKVRPGSANTPYDSKKGYFDLRNSNMTRVNVTLSNPEHTWPMAYTVTKPNGQKEEVIIPPGPFVRTETVSQSLNCSAGGCGVSQHMYLAHLNSSYYVVAIGSTLSDEVRGIFKNEAGQWKKIVDLPSLAENSVLAVEKCYIVWDNVRELGENPSGGTVSSVHWVNVCR